jgi:predicted PurR-regulated permease PerM
VIAESASDMIAAMASDASARDPARPEPAPEAGPQERILRLYLRTILLLVAVLLGVAIVLWLVLATHRIIVWLLIAVFLAVAINPLVALLERKGVRPRWLSVTIGLLVLTAALVGLGWLLVPPLVDQVNGFARALPGYVEDLVSGEGPLGFLERDYQIVERVREAVEENGGASLFGIAGGVANVATSTLTAIGAIVTVFVMTIFLLLGGPSWLERVYSSLPEETQERYRELGNDLYRSVGGYVRGNIAISLIAGGAAAAVLYPLGAPNALALCVIVAVFDLVPLIGATIGALIVALVLAFDSVTSVIVWGIFVIVYQQVENHLIQPVVYGRTVQLPAFAVFLAVLVGATLAGVVGALAAIPVASAIQILVRHHLKYRRRHTGPGRVL